MWCELSVWCRVERDLCCVETRWRDRTHGWTCHVLANSDWKVWQLHPPMWLSSLSPFLSPPSLLPSLPPPHCPHSPGSVNAHHVFRTLSSTLHHSLTVHPNYDSWMILHAEIHYGTMANCCLYVDVYVLLLLWLQLLESMGQHCWTIWRLGLWLRGISKMKSLHWSGPCRYIHTLH